MNGPALRRERVQILLLLVLSEAVAWAGLFAKFDGSEAASFLYWTSGVGVGLAVAAFRSAKEEDRRTWVEERERFQSQLLDRGTFGGWRRI